MLTRYTIALFTGLLFAAAACGDDDDDTGAGAKGGAGGAGAKGGTAGTRAEAGAGAAAEAGAGGAGGAGESLVERGQYLVDHVMVCSDCHTPRNMMGVPLFDQYMAGAECFVQLPNGDCLHSRNLTNDETGLKNRTDDEIKAMIRDGLRPSATGDEPLNPIMPYYVFHNMTPGDLDAVVAYLRTIPAVVNELPRSAEIFTVPAPANPIDPATIPSPALDFPERESALRGRYLAAEAGVCLECHTPHNMNSPDVLDPDTYFTGGEEFIVGLPSNPISSNLTSDPETGLGTWTLEDIVRVLKEGVDKEGNGICPPMPSGPMAAFGGLKDQDAIDIANYILSLPPKVNDVVDECSFPP